MTERHYSIYIIHLAPAVLGDRRFLLENPQYIAGKPCVYVGMTGISVDERIAQHKVGYKSSRIVRKYGAWRKKKLMTKLELIEGSLTHDEAVAAEMSVAAELRNRGYGVWQK